MQGMLFCICGLRLSKRFIYLRSYGEVGGFQVTSRWLGCVIVMSQDTAIATVDSLVAAFQHFNITHLTASEFFRIITEAGDGCEVQAATARGAVIPVCVYVLTPSTNGYH